MPSLLRLSWLRFFCFSLSLNSMIIYGLDSPQSAVRITVDARDLFVHQNVKTGFKVHIPFYWVGSGGPVPASLQQRWRERPLISTYCRCREKVELYLYSPYMPLWRWQGQLYFFYLKVTRRVLRFLDIRKPAFEGTENGYLKLSRYYSYKVKVKVTLVQALSLCTGRTAHRGSRGIALPFHDHGTRRGEGSGSHPGRTLPPGKTRYPLYRRLGGPQGR